LVFGRKGVLVNLVVPGRSPDTIHPKRGATKEGGQSEGEHGASDRRKGRDERERERERERRIEWRFDGTWDGQSAGTGDAAEPTLRPLKKTCWLLDERWTGETALDARWRRGSRSAAAQQQCRRLHHQEEEKQHPSGSRGQIGSAEAAVVAGLAALATAAAGARVVELLGLRVVLTQTLKVKIIACAAAIATNHRRYRSSSSSSDNDC
jgi:hypothetical protein